MSVKGITVMIGFLYLVGLIGYLVASGWGLEYSLEYWLSYSQGGVVDVPGLACYLLGPFTGGLSILAGIITWICSLAM
jgi:hypothetical protein